jgi:hypothetical protein
VTTDVNTQQIEGLPQLHSIVQENGRSPNVDCLGQPFSQGSTEKDEADAGHPQASCGAETNTYGIDGQCLGSLARPQ